MLGGQSVFLGVQSTFNCLTCDLVSDIFGGLGCPGAIGVLQESRDVTVLIEHLAQSPGSVSARYMPAHGCPRLPTAAVWNAEDLRAALQQSSGYVRDTRGAHAALEVLLRIPCALSPRVLRKVIGGWCCLISILCSKKPRLREGKELALGPPARQWWRWDLDPGLPSKLQSLSTARDRFSWDKSPALACPSWEHVRVISKPGRMRFPAAPGDPSSQPSVPSLVPVPCLVLTLSEGQGGANPLRLRCLTNKMRMFSSRWISSGHGQASHVLRCCRQRTNMMCHQGLGRGS